MRREAVVSRLELERSTLVEVADDLDLPRLREAIAVGVVTDEDILEAAILDLRALYPKVSRVRLQHAFTAGVVASRWLHVVRATAAGALAPEVDGDN